MNTHIFLILLLGAVAASPAWAADQANAGDALAQAQRFLLGEGSCAAKVGEVNVLAASH